MPPLRRRWGSLRPFTILALPHGRPVPETQDAVGPGAEVVAVRWVPSSSPEIADVKDST